MNNIKIGTDPEGWLYHKERKEFFPIIGLLGGSKEEPLLITDEGHAVQEDGCGWEFNIPPVTSLKDFKEACSLCLEHIQEIVGNEYALVIQPSVEFAAKYLRSKKANEIGCSADMDAYLLDYLPAPKLNSNYRYAGGHIHIGWENPTWDDSIALTHWLDLYLGIPFTLIDQDDNRKRVYGTAGRIRTKEYGVEYRTLSNLWLSDELLTNTMWEQVHLAIDAFRQKGNFLQTSGLHLQIQDAINTNNENKLKDLITSYGIIDNGRITECRERARYVQKATTEV